MVVKRVTLQACRTIYWTVLSGSPGPRGVCVRRANVEERDKVSEYSWWFCRQTRVLLNRCNNIASCSWVVLDETDTGTPCAVGDTVVQ